ncbi:MAG: PQQ-binding-like beta-propeller repeat protein [Planctomycetaceae bacterium]|nr:PQQ-binding-like beta-propeller repeat protein [Planctomycetaceae bacterium]
MRALTICIAAGWVCLSPAWGAAPEEPPPPRAMELVPPQWLAFTPIWQPTWDATLAANQAAWNKDVPQDKSLNQAHGQIVNLRLIELYRAMIQHFPAETAKHLDARRGIAQAYRNLGDLPRANEAYREMIAAHRDRKEIAAEAYQQILAHTPTYVPNQYAGAGAWQAYALKGLESLRGSLPETHPAMSFYWQHRMRMLVENRDYEQALHFYEQNASRGGADQNWNLTRATLLQAAGHASLAADVWQAQGNPDQAANLRSSITSLVQDYPRDVELEMRWEALRREAAGGAAFDAASLQNILDMCDSTGAFPAVKEPPYLPYRRVIERTLLGSPPEALEGLRQRQRMAAATAAAAVAASGNLDDAVRLFRRYSWAANVHEVMFTLAEDALRRGRRDWALRTFEDLTQFAADGELRRAAHVGVWLCLSGEGDSREALQRAMAAVPDSTDLPWRGGRASAAAVKKTLVTAAGSAAPDKPFSAVARRRVEMPADQAWAENFYESSTLAATLGPWAITTIEPLGGPGAPLLISGPTLAARYDAAVPRAVWTRSAPPGYGARRAISPVQPAWALPARRAPALRSKVADEACLFALVDDNPDPAARKALAAFDAASGDLIWSTANRPEWADLQPLNAPMAAAGHVYTLAMPAGAMEPQQQTAVTVWLTCLDAGDGRMIWKKSLAAQAQANTRLVELAQQGQALTLDGGWLYCSTNFGIVARCDARDGTIDWIWTYPPADQSGRSLVQFRRQGASPIVAGQRLILAPRDHSGVIALDAADGKLLWQSVLTASEHIVCVAGGKVIARNDVEISSLDLATGRELWFRRYDAPIDQTLARGADILMLSGGALCRLSPADGSVVEKRPLEGNAVPFLLDGATVLEFVPAPAAPVATPGAPPASPLKLPLTRAWSLPAACPILVCPPAAQPQETFFVLSGRTVTCIKRKPSPTVLWQQTLAMRPSAACYAGTALLLADGRDLVAVDLAGGAVRWTARPGFAVDYFDGGGDVAMAAETSRSGFVAVYDLATGKELWQKDFGEPARFCGQPLRLARVRSEDSGALTLGLYWNAMLHSDIGFRPAEMIVDAHSGRVMEVRHFLPTQGGWPRLVDFGPCGIFYVDQQSRPRLATYAGADPLAATKRIVDLGPIGRYGAAAAGMSATASSVYVRSPRELVGFDAASGRETVYPLPRSGATGRISLVYAVRETAGRLMVVSGLRGQSSDYPLDASGVFVDAFDRASGAHAGGQELPGIECDEFQRIGHDTQAELLDDSLIVSTRSGVHVFVPAPAAAPAEIVLHRSDWPMAIDGDLSDWNTVAPLPMTGGAGGSVRIAHDNGRLLLCIAHEGLRRTALQGAGMFNGGDRLDVSLQWAGQKYRWLIGADATGRAVARDGQGRLASDVVVARAGAAYEMAIPLAPMDALGESPQRIGLSVTVGGAGGMLTWCGPNGSLQPVALHPLARGSETAAQEIAKALGPLARWPARPARTAGGRFLSQWVCIASGPRPTSLAVGILAGGQWRYASLHDPLVAQAPPLWTQRSFLPWWIAPVPIQGQWIELRLPLTALDVDDKPIDGLAFRQEGPGRVIWDSTAVVWPGGSRVILEDDLPPGMSEGQWNWAADLKHSGAKAHEGVATQALDQVQTHSVVFTSPVADHLAAAPRPAVLSQWVYVDPTRPPAELALQLNNGRTWHRFLWGGDETGRRPMPAAGAWHELQVRLDQSDLSNRPITGIAFDQTDGRVFWGATTLLVDGKSYPVVTDAAPPTAAPGGAWRAGRCEIIGGVAPVEGKNGKGGQFDGRTGCIVTPHSAALHPAQLSIEGWVRLEPSTADQQWLVSTSEGSDDSQGYDLAVIDGRLRARVFMPGAAPPAVATSAEAVLQARRWQHVAMTWDGSAVRIYVDGQPVKTAVSAAPPAAPRTMGPTPLFIGRRASTKEGYLSACLDEWRLYERALSPAGVRSLYENPARPLPRALRQAMVIEWTFDDILAAPAQAQWQWLTQAGRKAHTLTAGAGGSVHMADALVTPITQHLFIDRAAAVATLARNLPALRGGPRARQLEDLLDRLEGGAPRRRPIAGEPGAVLRDWQIVGGFHNNPANHSGFGQLWEPELKAVDLQERYGVWPGEGGPAQWRLLRSRGAYVDLLGETSFHQMVCAVAVCWVYVPQPRHVRFDVGCDESIDVRVNRRLVHMVRGSAAAKPGDTAADAMLPAGWSEIMIKVGQGTGTAFGFYFEIRDALSGEAVEGLERATQAPQE